MKNYFNTNLKYLRTRNGIEQLELANMLGLKSASAVSEWEKGTVYQCWSTFVYERIIKRINGTRLCSRVSMVKGE